MTTYDIPDTIPAIFDHVMVDIETLDSKPTGVVLSVAMVAFDPYQPEAAPTPVMHIHINRSIQAGDEGRTISKDTIVWWSEQTYDAQIRMLRGQQNAIDPSRAREHIAHVVGMFDNIWANGPDFDCVVLRDFMGDGFKWPFWKHRCVRTVKNLWADKVAGVPKPLVAHDALEDCMYQIALVQAALTPCKMHADNTTAELVANVSGEVLSTEQANTNEA